MSPLAKGSKDLVVQGGGGVGEVRDDDRKASIAGKFVCES